MSDDKGPRRPATDILIIVLTIIVAFFIISTTLYVIFAEIHDPLIDTSKIAEGLSNIISAILGALLGLIAGKTGGEK